MSAKKTLSTLTGRVGVAGPTQAVQGVLPIIAPGPIPFIQEDLHQTLGGLRDQHGADLLSQKQITQLDSITLSNGRKFFSLDADSRGSVYQIVSQIYAWGFDAVYTAITSQSWDSREQFYFSDSPGMGFSRQKARIDAEIYKNKVEVAKGAFKCRKCGSEETVAVEKQIRAADEPSTIKVTCIHCNNKWTQ